MTKIEEELPPGFWERAWNRLRPLARREQAATGWRVRLRATRLPIFVTYALAVAVLALPAVPIWSLYRQPAAGMGLAFPVTWTALLLVALVCAVAKARATLILEIDRHRVTMRRTAMGLTDIAGIETVAHTYRWFELQMAARYVPATHAHPLRRRYDVVIRGGDGRELRLPLQVATQAEAQTVVGLLRRTMDEARLPVGYRDAPELGTVPASRSGMRFLAMSFLVGSVLSLAACRTQPLEPGGGGSGGGGGGGSGVFPDLGISPLPDAFTNDGFLSGGSDLGPSPPTSIPCGRSGADPGPGNPFKHAQYGVVANWRGYATSPWTSAPWTVEIDFMSTTYNARTLDSSGVGWPVPPFYYDSNPESDTYHLTNLESDGTIIGQLYLSFSPTPDDISGLTLNSDLTHLHFEFYNGSAGPVVYELDCY